MRIAIANFLADLVFHLVSYIACGRRFVVVSFRRFKNTIAGNNFKAVCDSVNNKVPVTIGFEVVYPGLSVKVEMLSWLVGLLEVTLWALLDVRAVDDPGCNLAPSKHVESGSLAKGILLTN